MSLVLFASCGYKSEVKPLKGDLATFTAKSIDGENIVTGVKNLKTGEIIIKPLNYLSITADDYFIVCKDDTDKFFVYNLTGEPQGVFDTFTHFNNYYLGTSYKKNWCYFVKSGEIIQYDEKYAGLQHLIVHTFKSWQIRDYTGNLVWSIPVEQFYLIKDTKATSETLYIAYQTKDKKPQNIIADTTGKTLKKLTNYKWNLLIKKLQNTKPLGSATYGEMPDVKKF